MPADTPSILSAAALGQERRAKPTAAMFRWEPTT